MAKKIDEKVYEEVIDALNTFCKEVADATGEMESAAKDCVNNCEQDEASIKSKEKVDKCITSFQAAIEKAQKLAKAMQEELTQAQEAAKKAENI
ncbi:MAG: hypothetical protein MR380_11550 [Lachnospiraceae bacterium]|nr:hypothetical protein [Lachnospiraceae bacterium]